MSSGQVSVASKFYPVDPSSNLPSIPRTQKQSLHNLIRESCPDDNVQ